MEFTAIINIIAVKNAPKMIFSHLFMVGFNRMLRQTINAGIANISDAVNNFAGLSNIFVPLTSDSACLGT